MSCVFSFFIFLLFFFNDPATTEIYTLSLHDALPILSNTLVELPSLKLLNALERAAVGGSLSREEIGSIEDRKSTRLNSSHTVISYAVFCLKKKKKKITRTYSNEK